MIRPARFGDGPGIAKVHVESWRETYAGLLDQAYLDAIDLSLRTKRWTRQVATPGQLSIFVAEEAGEIVGFASAGAPQQPELGFASELQCLYLLKRGQKKGLGRQLFERAAEAMRAKGHKDLYCWVVRENPAAAFYRKMGGAQKQAKVAEIGQQSVTEDLFLWQLAPVQAKK